MPAFKKVKKNPGGRPPKLNDKVIADIVNHLRIGCYLETAVVMAGVQKTIFYEWIKLAHKGSKEHVKLLNAVEKAVEECTTRDLMVIDKCANGNEGEYLRDDDGKIVYTQRGNPVMKKAATAPDWSAAAWRLQRRKPKEWGNTEKLEVSGKDGGPIQSQQVEETEEEKIARKARIAAKLAKLQSIDG